MKKLKACANNGRAPNVGFSVVDLVAGVGKLGHLARNSIHIDSSTEVNGRYVVSTIKISCASSH
jgi:hypothetical protein